MKRPNIVLHRGRWHCSPHVTKVQRQPQFYTSVSGTPRYERIGFGLTPSEAYSDWLMKRGTYIS
jgi:hypothetical protein